MMILPTVCLIESIIKNKIIKIIINIFASLSMIIIILITGINNKDCFKYVYYYFYFLYPLFFICYLIYDLNKKDINIEENKIEYNE
jgi:bacteriorhodopsin